MKYSKERIFMSCNLYGHCLAAHLIHPLKIEEKLVYVVYILNLVISESELNILIYNLEHSIHTTNVMITVSCFLDEGNPCEPLELKINLDNIYELESIEPR